MGFNFIGSCCENKVNPNPNKFSILKVAQCGSYVVSLIKYNDALNYEGKKILVFKNCYIDDIDKSENIDPHFCDKNHLSPIARFVPTSEGWDMAVKFCTLKL